jgi:serine/threonine protein kinase
VTAASRYDLTDQIGHGPNGTMWRAWDRATGEVAAVKALHRHLGTDRGVVDRFRRERPVLTGYFHEAFVRVRDLITESGVCLVTELIDGLDLRYHLATSGQVPAPVAGNIAAAVASALSAAHLAGAVHGDIKPANLLLEELTGQVRITDLRVARLARGALGPASPEYVAPEVLAGGPPVPASDVYALCAVLVEMLTGAVPFPAGTSPYLSGSRVAPLPGRLPALLRPLVSEGLRPEPELRPTAAQLAVELYAMLPALALVFDEELVGFPAHLPRTPPARRPTPAHGRQPRHAARRLGPLPVLAGVAAAVIVAGSAVAGPEPPRPARPYHRRGPATTVWTRRRGCRWMPDRRPSRAPRCSSTTGSTPSTTPRAPARPRR